MPTLTRAVALRLEDVGVRYGGFTALTGVSCSIGSGELVAVVGPNGAGKSTLFRAVAGLVPHSGTVAFGGEICHHRRGRMHAAFIPQRSDVNLDFPIRVAEVVMLGRRRFLRLGQRPRRIDRDAVSLALEQVNLADRRDRPLGSLSGGQIQRVFLARALAQEADVLLLDESLSGVDRPSTESLVTLFEELAAAGTTLLVSTHDLALARGRFARCLAINGRLVADGPPRACLSDRELEAVFGSTTGERAGERHIA
ncbi:MAG: metal ABC transporter ATP-binding protein [Actinobacteria bacterium]|nr:metal ABC transporter ATP-binding protein [Actinomycetota bacterium]